MSYFNMNPKIKTMKSKEKIKQFYEYGAHFKYSKLYRILIDLMNSLPSERLGNEGIYFEGSDNENNDNNGVKNYSNEKKNYKKINLLQLKNKILFKRENNQISLKKITLKKEDFLFIKNNYHSNRNNKHHLFLNFMNQKLTKTLRNFSNKNTYDSFINSEDKKKKIPLEISFNQKRRNICFNLNKTINNKFNKSEDNNNNKFYLPKINFNKIKINNQNDSNHILKTSNSKPHLSTFLLKKPKKTLIKQIKK